MSLLGGSKSSSTKVVQKRDIPLPTAEERRLLSNLIRLGYHGYRPSSYFTGVLRTFYRPSEEFVREMQNPYVSMLPYQEKWGEFANRLAARGILNSTITQDALKELGKSLAERAAELRWKTLGLLETARQASLADQLRRAAMLEDARRLSIADEYNRLYRIWKTLYSGRMGTPTVTTSHYGPSLFSQALGQAVGLGGGIALGSALKGLFEGGGSASAATAAGAGAAGSGLLGWMSAHPWATAGIAGAGGLLLGSIL